MCTVDWPSLDHLNESNLGMVTLERHYSYEILSEEELEMRAKFLIDRIVEQLSVTPTESSMLLRYYR